jgi:ammonia channel protein AmtB
MTPGLAFFYGDMVRAKSVLNMLMMSFSALGTVGILWVLFGYSVSFGNDIRGTDTRGLNTLKPLTISQVSDRALH